MLRSYHKQKHAVKVMKRSTRQNDFRSRTYFQSFQKPKTVKNHNLETPQRDMLHKHQHHQGEDDKENLRCYDL